MAVLSEKWWKEEETELLLLLLTCCIKIDKAIYLHISFSLSH